MDERSTPLKRTGGECAESGTRKRATSTDASKAKKSGSSKSESEQQNTRSINKTEHNEEHRELSWDMQHLQLSR